MKYFWSLHDWVSLMTLHSLQSSIIRTKAGSTVARILSASNSLAQLTTFLTNAAWSERLFGCSWRSVETFRESYFRFTLVIIVSQSVISRFYPWKGSWESCSVLLLLCSSSFAFAYTLNAYVFLISGSSSSGPSTLVDMMNDLFIAKSIPGSIDVRRSFFI